MKIIFIAHFYFPHIGGVEKHVNEVAKALIRKGNDVTILTEKFSKDLKDKEVIDGVKIVRIRYPHIKLIGLIFIWLQIIKNYKLIQSADVIHVHDVFIWYLPFRFLFLSKKNIMTIHGLEWDNPLSKVSLWQKKLALKLSNKSVGVGLFLEKYLKTKFDLNVYGATKHIKGTWSKTKNSIVYVGRLEKNTGLLKFLEWLNKNQKYKAEFCGDGPLKSECEKFGKVYGFIDPSLILKKSEYCVPGGYLAALEALSYKCELKLFWNNKVKKDYWNMSPFVLKKVKSWANNQTWDKIADEYLDLYKFSGRIKK